MKQLIRFPSIEQFRTTIRTVVDRAHWTGRDENDAPIFNRDLPVPILRYKGTVKLHGTNAAIGYDGSEVWCQSRDNILEIGQDNAGFAGYVGQVGHDKIIRLIEHAVPGGLLHDHTVMIYGEWCGKGIQSGCAIHKLDKMFVIFAVRLVSNDPEGGAIWLSDETLDRLKDESIRFYSINSFQTYEIEIDFSNPQAVKDPLEALTKAINDSCPIGKHFGVDGVGEGIVWRCTTTGYWSSSFWFKTKGADHKVASTKALVEVDVEKVKTHTEFAEIVLSEPRLNQGIEFLKTNGHGLNERSTGHFIKWVHSDVVKEELDRAVASGIEEKEIGKIISTKARAWYFDRIEA